MIILIILAILGYMLIGTVLAGLEIKYEGYVYRDFMGDHSSVVAFFMFVWPLYLCYCAFKFLHLLLLKIANKIAGE